MLEVLPLFPRGIDQSILAAVFVGLATLLFLTESFGWVYAGLIVPGYLASVFAFSPAAGVAVCLESVLTYLAARAINESFSRSGAGAEFFGRDRFFLIVLVSVIVRQLCELWLLPVLARHLDPWLGTSLALDGSLSSIGLVLVPLTANSFWKLDLPRGVFQVGVPTLITYVVVARILLPLTNLSYAHQELTYEDAALNFLASPKAYVILLTAAYLASRFNLDYGWDYNGILVPGLLALTWFSPLRALTTVGETLTLYLLARGFVRLPIVRGWNLEGPRRVAMVFALSLTLRALLALAVGERDPNVHAQDLFGFGYLLPSLLAAKMIQAKAVGRVIIPAVHASLVGFVAGSLVGFMLELIAPRDAPIPRTLAEVPLLGFEAPTVESALVTAVGRSLDEGAAAAVEPEQGRFWARALVASFASGDEGQPLVRLEEASGRLGMMWTALPRDHGRQAFVVREPQAEIRALQGRDTWVVRRGAAGPILLVLRAHAHPATLLGARAACGRTDCVALVVAGAPREDVGSEAREVARQSGRGLVVIEAVESAEPEIACGGRVPSGIDFAALLPGAPVVLGGTVDEVVRVRASSHQLVQGLASEAHVPGVRLVEALLGAPRSAPAPYRAPRETELRLLAQIIVPELVRAAVDGSRDAWVVAREVALPLGLDVRVLDDGLGEGQPVALVEERARSPGWGALVVALGERAPLAVFATQPEREAATDRIALDLFSRLRARALVVGGDEAIRAPDTSDDWNAREQVSVAFAYHVALHRSLPRPGSLPAIVHVRGLSDLALVDGDVCVGLGAPVLHPLQPGPAVRALVSSLAPRGRWSWADGRAETIGLDGSHDVAVRFSVDSGTVEAAVAWFTAAERQRWAPRMHADLAALARATALEWRPEDFARRWVSDLGEVVEDEALGSIDDATLADLRSVLAVEGPAPIRRLSARGRVVAGMDWSLGRPFVGLERCVETACARTLVLEGANGPLRVTHASGAEALLEQGHAVEVHGTRLTP